MVLPAPSPHRAGAQLARECRPRVEAGGLQPRGSARQLMRYAASWRAEAGTEVPVLAVAAIGVSSKRAPTRWLVQLVQHRALCLAVTAAAQSGVAVSSPGTIYPDAPGARKGLQLRRHKTQKRVRDGDLDSAVFQRPQSAAEQLVRAARARSEDALSHPTARIESGSSDRGTSPAAAPCTAAHEMPQQRKRRRSTAADGAPRARKRTVATAPGGTNPVPVAQEAAPGPVVTTSAALSNNTAIVDIGGLPCCPPDAKTKIMGLLNHEEKATTRWTFPFKDGERFETAEFTQLSCYGPPANKGRYVLCSKLGEGSFSCVFKSWDTVAKDFVAMKFTLSRCVLRPRGAFPRAQRPAGRRCVSSDPPAAPYARCFRPLRSRVRPTSSTIPRLTALSPTLLARPVPGKRSSML
jgi:hypothetical protein